MTTDIAIDILERHACAGSWWFDPDSQELWWSDGIYRLFGRDPAAGPPPPDRALADYARDSIQCMQKAIAAALKQHKGWNLQLKIGRTRGEIRHVQNIGRVEARCGKKPLLSGVVFDLHRQTPQRRARRQSRLPGAEARVDDILTRSPIGIARLAAADGRWLSANPALCAMLGYTEDQLLETTAPALTHPDDHAADAAHCADLVAGRSRCYCLDKRFIHRDGRVVHVQIDASVARGDGGGEPQYFTCQIQDRSGYYHTQVALARSRELADVTLEAIDEGVIRVDADCRITRANAAAAALLNVAKGSLEGQAFDNAVVLFDGREKRRFKSPVKTAIAAGRRFSLPIFTRLRRADGGYLSVMDSTSVLHDREGRVDGAVFVFRDVGEARRMNDERAYQAHRDTLTGLSNRRDFEQALIEVWRRINRGAGPACLLYMDLDHFKIVNDTCGHAAGDELLREAAARLQASLRDSDFLARIGSDEFAAIVFLSEQRDAGRVADKLVREIDGLRFDHEDNTYRVSLSMGIAAIDMDLETPEQAMVHADAALYVAQERGRNRYHIYGEQDDRSAPAADYVNTAQMLQLGLDHDRFSLDLQAIVNATGDCLGYEALLRLNTASGDTVRPDVFLPTAKRLGMMSRIDRWVVNAALSLVDHYERRGQWPQGRYLSINLSPAALADSQFHPELIALLDAHAAGARHVAFEITESDELSGGAYNDLIRDLRRRGFGVWLDDFAAGYNSFSMLKRIEVDGIKIDRAFVEDIEYDAVSRAVIRSIADISQALGLGVVAEGVETRSTLDTLMASGFTRFQGYLFHRPEPGARLLERLGEQALSD